MEEQGVRRQDASPLVLTIGGPLLAVLVFVAVALPFAGFLEDDALISATYSARLLEGHGLTWVDGNRVEGYSNLLWVLTLALIGLVEPDLVIALRILAVTCFAGTVVLLARWTTGGLWAVSGSTMAAILFATAGPVSAWTFGGLEQPLLAILLVAGSSMVLSLISVPERRLREFVAPGTVFGLLCLVRPDAPLFCLPAGLAVLVSGRTLGAALRRVAVLAAMPILAVAGQLAFRLIYYGAWLPNTALVKISPSFGHVGHGTQYVAEGWIASSPLAIAAAISIAALCLRTGRRPEVVYLVAGPAVWSTYLVLVGGGTFPAYRHFVPVAALLAVAVAHGAGVAVADRVGTRARVLLCSFLLMLPIANLVIQRAGAEFDRARKPSWVWAGREIAEMLVDAYGDDRPLTAVTAAGCIPFWTGFPCIDMLGLNDPWIARRAPGDVGEGMIGHEHGDGAYVLGREPDIVQPCGPWGGLEPCYRTVRELHESGLLQEHFEPVILRRPPGRGGDHIRSTVWLRRSSPIVGIRAEGDQLTAPGVFIRPQTGEPGTGWVVAADQVVTPLVENRPYWIRVPEDRTGPWRIRLDPPLPVSVGPQTGASSIVSFVPLRSGFVETVRLSMEQPAIADGGSAPGP